MKSLPISLKQLIQVLSDHEFHSGTQLGERLKITRSAIWKLIKQLQDYAIDIECVHGKGYRLKNALALLESKTILSCAEHLNIKPKIEIFASITSTQDYLKEKSTTRETPLICFAEHQSAGRGRLGRKWHSPFGVNLIFSCLWPIQKDISELGGLSLVTGLAIIRGLSEYGFKENTQIKWPNDIYCEGEKLAGVLIEVTGETHGATQVLIGIGLNVNMQERDQHKIDQPSTSLQKITKKNHDRSELAGHIIHWLFDYLQEFERYGLKQFLPIWRQHDYLKGQTITLQTGQQSFIGEACGINEHGQLRLKIGDEIRTFAAGDTKVRPNLHQ